MAITIGGRSYTLACADGEEAHVRNLGRLIDEKAVAAGAVGQSEPRMLLFAAMLLADEIHDLTARRDGAAQEADQMARRIDTLAGRVENIAALLETALESARHNA
ncbi:cell division protein ZapA [Novosphingobium colocasiae]|uniref:cell division protein ZapA n=1 Tax=Novosphingobium colocasiae TaxID=1256513 RepID=UPI0035AF2135